MKTKKLIIIGNTVFAEIAYEYFSHDSPYEVVAFSVESDFLKEKKLFGLPVIPFEQLNRLYDPDKHKVFVSATYTLLNRLRTRLSKEVKEMGYKLASYISSRCYIWPNVKIGEHCFIFEDNTIQPFVEIGDNNILWSGNHIGHHSVISNNNFISSHVVISGLCSIGSNCFFGVNSTFANNLNISDDTVVGSGSVIMKDTQKGKVYIGNPAKISKKTSLEAFGIDKKY